MGHQSSEFQRFFHLTKTRIQILFPKTNFYEFSKLAERVSLRRFHTFSFVLALVVFFFRSQAANQQPAIEQNLIDASHKISF